MRLTLLCLAVALTLLPACGSKDDTKIVVAVWSDLTVPSELDSVRIDVAGPTDKTFAVFPLTASAESGKTQLPALLELVPLGAHDATFSVEATGLLQNNARVSQKALVTFVAGQSLLLQLFLARSCQAATCPAEYTCAYGACNRPVVVPNLPLYDPRVPLSPPDGGGGLDAGSSLDGSAGEMPAADLVARDTSVLDLGIDADVGAPFLDGSAGEMPAADLVARDTSVLDLGIDADLDAPSPSDGVDGDGRHGDASADQPLAFDVPFTSDLPRRDDIRPEAPVEVLIEICMATGGILDTQFCCGGISDLPDTCGNAFGACTCNPVSAKAVRTCACPNNGCFSHMFGCMGVDGGSPSPDAAADRAGG
jgi:hypothetical protein